MNLRQIIEQIRNYFRKDAAPPPRWQVITASIYLGMLLFLIASRSGLL